MSLFIYIFAAVFILIYIIAGAVKGFGLSILGFFRICVSAVLSYSVTVILQSFDITSVILGYIVDTDFSVKAEGVSELLKYIFSCLLNPFLFSALFILICVVLLIPSLLLSLKINKEKKKHRFGGLLIGIICGAVVYSVITFPVSCTLRCLSSGSEEAVEVLSPYVGNISFVGSETKNLSDVKRGIDSVTKENKLFSLYSNDIFYGFYKNIAGTYTGSEHISVPKETEELYSVAAALASFTENAENYGEKQLRAVDIIISYAESSDIHRKAVADFISVYVSEYVSTQTGFSWLGTTFSSVSPVTVIADLKTAKTALEIYVEVLALVQ